MASPQQTHGDVMLAADGDFRPGDLVLLSLNSTSPRWSPEELRCLDVPVFCVGIWDEDYESDLGWRVTKIPWIKVWGPEGKVVYMDLRYCTYKVLSRYEDAVG